MSGVQRRLGGRATYSRRVSAADVGQRVSVRFMVTDDVRGPMPTDVVGRLCAIDEDMLLVIDRAHKLHMIPAADVVASKTVPEHPRLQPEPDVPTREAPLRRDAARMLILDAADRVLLVAHAPHHDERVWTAPGGGLTATEDGRAAARREVAEELALDVEPGACIMERVATFEFRGIWIEQHERWFLGRTTDVDIEAAPLNDASIVEARWWSAAELAETQARLAPSSLPQLFDQLIVNGAPDEPWLIEG